ncbi:hypothetical protein [Noviherbaspirillum saxi]|uniref:Uncharacterized protein n=1 Tax=Noviherbaspirillum saxi TaxID=2320863 RepID=A0A3A3FP75_9BURK|nr:hypothetical protein [Noviherbaspirillum saxi]RJF95252.1 hypothetical protein D3871_17585 [Noviherbaspirillum saxi]
MNDSALLLTLCYVAVAFLLLVLCLATHWPRWVKMGMIGIVTLSYLFAQGAFQRMLGWPADERLPEKFVLLAVVTQEPDKEHGVGGALYLWVNAIRDNRPVPEPRAYRLAYRKDLHSVLNDAMKKSRQGISQIGSTEAPAGGKVGSWLRNAADPNVKVRISDAPSPSLPEK